MGSNMDIYQQKLMIYIARAYAVHDFNIMYINGDFWTGNYMYTVN